MGEFFDPLTRNGWRLFKAKSPDISSAALDQLIERAIVVAAGGVAGPLRRSRRGTTFRLRFKADAACALDVFVKIIDAPSGFAKVKRWMRGSRAAHIARVTAAINQSGFVAPPILLYGAEEPSGREMVVALRANGNGPLVTLAALAGSPMHKWAMLRALGQTVARLHRAGFVLGDLTPFNIFIQRGEPPRFTFFDHDRTRRTLRPGRARRQLRNLVQLGRFDLPGVTRTDRMRVLHGYVSACDPPTRRALVRTVAKMVERRRGRDGCERVNPL
jgi:lipopolysaccharide kinase (Kdo/WaaP) family protein